MAANKIKIINIARDFSPVPAGRHLSDGNHSGEAFRTKHLEPALRAGYFVNVILDYTEGFGSSFLEEAFGGLVRAGIPKECVSENLAFTAETPSGRRYKSKIEQYIKDAIKASR